MYNHIYFCMAFLSPHCFSPVHELMEIRQNLIWHINDDTNYVSYSGHSGLGLRIWLHSLHSLPPNGKRQTVNGKWTMSPLIYYTLWRFNPHPPATDMEATKTNSWRNAGLANAQTQTQSQTENAKRTCPV